MLEHENRIEELKQKLEALLSKQEGFAKELMSLHQEIKALEKRENGDAQTASPPLPKRDKNQLPPLEISKAKGVNDAEKEPIVPPQTTPQPPTKVLRKPKIKSNWEKFIGENLINKIGIIITVLGIAIGAKYSIDNNLISPLTRIILGYLAGLCLLGLGIKLKTKYTNYSAVLVSGALATLYFITFAAYGFYGLFPQATAFGLMLIFTVFGVVAALHYDNQLIAHIGLVGAYAVPFLLSNDTGSPDTLFSYMGIINIGILVIAYKKYWSPLYFSSFIITWLIFGSWLAFSYAYEEYYTTALLFCLIFFLIFYATFLSYKLKATEKFKKSDITLLLSNSFIFFGLGYGLLSESETGAQLFGVYTLGNAVVHFIVSVIVHKRKLADQNLYNLVSGLVLVFLTISIPIQLDGNWVTLLWGFEAALLFWIGRKRNVTVYENLSYPLMVLALFSLCHDWIMGYTSFPSNAIRMNPVLNTTFLTSLLLAAAFGFIQWTHTRTGKTDATTAKNTLYGIVSFLIPSILLFVLYMGFFLEIYYYWDTLYEGSKVALVEENGLDRSTYNQDLKYMGHIWLLNYSLVFVSLLNFINIKKLHHRVLGIGTIAAALFTLFAFLTMGLYILSELRESYLDQPLAQYYGIGSFNLIVRYVCFGFLALLIASLYQLIRQPFLKTKPNIPFVVILHMTIIWVSSSELLHWMDIAGSHQSYKLGLSILWGSYALLLVILGIWHGMKILRVLALILFATTLIKLFFYDIASLNTISKTIVFVSLGMLLLIISFLYNKYKKRISDEDRV
ncbi:DUF2339 domain-containing protein [Maribacter polysaccharolyticus]|uniref:DUF2339 domain-containing protein n=1 Tax=Maribacter polysaccharolyticus TaxID=3020831 RepID=UPI00237F2E95|nr:DUF2339 domain-containing protein [Maribacter polysaccharolyticus]MDE3741946.1 DUF2339 domain-containing protein [Maribacter polysaccharolyticus]